MKNYSSEQSGRSMIEMLGVLAIVGVLSVAGIAGYSKAMGKFKTNKAMDQITTLSSNIKTMFAGVGNYDTTLTTESAYNLGLIPEEMTKTCAATFADTCVIGAMNGTVKVEGKGSTFEITLNGINKEACSVFVSGEWGGSSGFAGLTSTKAGVSLEANSDAAATITETAKCAKCSGSDCDMVFAFR